MANSIQRDINGPDWCLGLITVAASGTPVNLMSLVDPNVTETTASPLNPEFTTRFQQIIFQAVKSIAPVVANTGAVYIVRKGVGGGSGNKADSGSIVKILAVGETFVLAASALSLNVLSPYRYFIDADNNGDGCLVTGIVAG